MKRELVRTADTSRVKEILRLHAEIEAEVRTTLPKAIRLGQLLVEQKAELGHGEWLPWVKANCPFSDRSAQDYMKYYRRRRELKTATVADLPGARKLLAASRIMAKRITAKPITAGEWRAAHAEPVGPAADLDARLLQKIRPQLQTMSLGHRLRSDSLGSVKPHLSTSGERRRIELEKRTAAS